MAYQDRVSLYQAIEELRGRPLIAYVTSTRPFADGLIAQDAVAQFEDQLLKLPSNRNDLDLLIISNGGDPLAAWRIVSIIREHLGSGGKLTALIPHNAFSAATLLALGADDIFMHPFSCLGPVDPQLTSATIDGRQQRFSYEDVSAFVEFLRSEGKISDQSQVGPLLSKLLDEINPTTVGFGKRSSILSVDMAKKLLSMHMTNETEINRIAEAMNKSFFSHGHAVSRTEALKLGLKIADSNDQLSDLLWQIYASFEKEMRVREPLNLLCEVFKSPGSEMLLKSPIMLNLPSDLPPQLMAEVWKLYLSTTPQTYTPPEVECETIQQCVESLRHASLYRQRMKVLVMRRADLNFQFNAPFVYQSWEVVGQGINGGTQEVSVPAEQKQPIKADDKGNKKVPVPA